jgi:hypothetical protein
VGRGDRCGGRKYLEYLPERGTGGGTTKAKESQRKVPLQLLPCTHFGRRRPILRVPALRATVAARLSELSEEATAGGPFCSATGSCPAGQFVLVAPLSLFDDCPSGGRLPPVLSMLRSFAAAAVYFQKPPSVRRRFA